MSSIAPAKTTQTNNKPVNGSVLQRKTCSCGRPVSADGECAECRKKRLALQRRAVNRSGPASAPPIVHDVLHSPGKPLDTTTQQVMESHFSHDFSQVKLHIGSSGPQTRLTIGRVNDPFEQEADRVARNVSATSIAAKKGHNSGNDFSDVRLHTDGQAARSARAVNAQAYTVGRHVVFGSGQYQPQSAAGKNLLAHELVHVLQQTGAGGVIQRTLNDGHDLTATRFSGNIVLEAVYDDEQLIQNGSSGTAVRLIQESLIAQGYAFPLFGADGDFGDETESQVRRFQIDTGALKLDGLVGPETMKLLDMHDPGGTATTGPVPGPAPAIGPPRPPATAAVFSEHPQEQFAGYDNTTAPNDSLAVPVNGRRQAQVAVTPAPALPAFVSDTPGVATVEPTPDGVAVTGVSHGTAKITAREGATVLDTLDVTVKNRLDRSVAFHYVCDSRPAAAGGPHCSNGNPAANVMRSLLNRVWERQTNVRFTGGASANVVAPGDLGAAVDWTSPGGGEWNIVTGLGLAADYHVFRVWHYLQDGAPTNDAANLGSNTIIGDNPCADGLGLPHEAGHFLGLDHPDGFLMTPCPGARTQRVSKAITDKVNP